MSEATEESGCSGPTSDGTDLRSPVGVLTDNPGMDTFWGLNATGWTAIYTCLTAGLLAIAGLAAWYAKGQWSSTDQTREDARVAAKEAHRPYIIVTIEPSRASQHLFDLVIKNVGVRPAKNVRVSLDPAPKRAREIDGLELAKAKILTEPIAMIAPSQDLRSFYDSHINRNGMDLPSIHKVTLSYSDTSGTTYTEESVLDIEAHKGATFTDVLTTHELVQTLRNISTTLRTASVLRSSGTLDVEAANETWDERQVRYEREREQQEKEAEEAKKWFKELEAKLVPPTNDDTSPI